MKRIDGLRIAHPLALAALVAAISRAAAPYVIAPMSTGAAPHRLKGGVYRVSINGGLPHHYVEFNVGRQAAKNGWGWSVAPSGSAGVRLLNALRDTKRSRRSRWHIDSSTGHVRYSLKGPGIDALRAKAGNLTVCWFQ